MKWTVKQPMVLSNGIIKAVEVEADKIIVPEEAVIGIDGSTTNTGIGILRASDGALMYIIDATREKANEEPVRYKVRLKKEISKLLERNPKIKTIFYEEPCISHASAVKNLFMLRSSIEELIIENEPDFDYIKYHEINNMRWKKHFLNTANIKVPTGTENQKKAVHDLLVKYLPYMEGATQDSIDAIAMAFACVRFMVDGKDPEELESRKKITKFNYNIAFTAADTDDDIFMEFGDLYKGPESILENGIVFRDVQGKENFEKTIFKEMGSFDKVLILKFASKHHADIILKHNIGSLAAKYDYVYAVVWRKSRKAS